MDIQKLIQNARLTDEEIDQFDDHDMYWVRDMLDLQITKAYWTLAHYEEPGHGWGGINQWDLDEALEQAYIYWPQEK